MADGLLCTADVIVENVIDKTLVKTCESGEGCATLDTRNSAGAKTVHFPYSNGGILPKLCCGNGAGCNTHSNSASSSPFKLDIAVGVVDVERMQPCSPSTEEDCRKKRCVDRYDSSESSDSGVAVLSCTDCSGSSTASSDITDPGSPYSTTSNHSDQDSNNPTLPTNIPNQSSPPHANKPPQAMRPTAQLQSSAHHPPWHWAEDSSPPLKRPPNQSLLVTSTPVPKTNNTKIPPAESLLKSIVVSCKTKMQQGKITEYFKSHHKPKEFLTLVDKIKREKKNLVARSVPPPGKVAIEKLAKPRKAPTITTPRKILPAPSRVSVNQPADHLVNNLTNITNYPTQTMTLTTLTFPTATYIHKPPSATRAHDQMFIPQFANQFVHHPHHQAISNYIKINVPIVKLNTIATPTSMTAGSPTVLARTAGAAQVVHSAHGQMGGVGVATSLDAAVSLSGTALAPNAFVITNSTNNGSNKRKCSNSNSKSNNKSVCSVAETISSPLALLPNGTNNVVTTTLTTASTQPSINVTVSDISSKISTSSNVLSSICYVKDLSTSNNSKTTLVLHNQTLNNNNNNNKTSKTPQTIALNSTKTKPSSDLTKSPPAIDQGLKSSPTPETTDSPNKSTPSPPQSARSSPVDSEDSGISSASSTRLTSLSLPLELSPLILPCQKSPILSVPKTIRFPAAVGTVLGSAQVASQLLGGNVLKKRKSCVGGGDLAGRNGGVCTTAEKRALLAEGVVPCMWSECHAQFEASGTLLEHLQIKHVISQATCEHYVCLWQGCKVHGRTSCSRSWLERHVLAHAGTKPFRCIVDGCGMRFNSQLTLQRHVNGHFNGDQNQNGTSKKSVENALKLYKRNGKKIRFRRQPWSARMFDFIDASIMEGLQYQLVKMTEKRTHGQYESNVGNTAILQVQVLGRRVQTDGARQLLVRYHPKNILPDEWIKDGDFSHTKTVKICSLKSSAKDSLRESLFTTTATTQLSKKHRRKPVNLKST